MKVLTVKQIRMAEENAVKNGIFSYKELMLNAGRAAAEIICRKYSIIGKRVAVVCGVGNNGGDGYVIAGELSRMGCFVTVILPLGSAKTETARQYFNFLPSVTVTDSLEGDYDFIIDALFGIGLDRPLTGVALETVDFMNLCTGIKIAVDIPSGVMPDGNIAGRAVKCDLTVTFIAHKDCLLKPPAWSYCGEISVADIGAPVVEYEYRTTQFPSLKKRISSAHKGDFGKVLIIAGSYGMCGAEILAAKASLRSGVGIVKAVVCDKNYAAFAAGVPEAVTHPVNTDKDGGPVISIDELEKLQSEADAVLIGPGLGNGFSARQTAISALRTAKKPIVLDADGINAVLLDIDILKRLKAPAVITPHPGEMARLCNKTVPEIESDRIGFAKRFSSEYGVVTVLKGKNTVIASPDGEVFLNTTGNVGLATGGSGDVLSGITVSLLAQGYSAFEAAKYAVYIHGLAADKALQKTGYTSMLPSDVIAELKTLFD